MALLPSKLFARIDDAVPDNIDVPCADALGRMDEVLFESIDDPDAKDVDRRGFDGVVVDTKPGGGCGLAEGVKLDGINTLAVARISPRGFD